MDGELFDFCMSSMEDCGLIIVMEDGAPYHRGAASVRRAQLEKDGIIFWGPGVWPANSPDLNPIENLWHILPTNIRKRPHVPSSIEELIAALKEEWAKIDIKPIITYDWFRRVTRR